MDNLYSEDIEGKMDAEIIASSEAKPHSTAEFTKATFFFTDKHSVGLINRQKNAVEQVIRLYSKGFYISDLKYVQELIQHLLQQLAVDESFADILLRLLQTSSLPFQQDRVSDPYKLKPIIVSFLETIINLLEHKDQAVQLQAAKVLLDIILRSATQESLLLCLKELHISQFIVSALQLLNNSSQALKKVLQEIIKEFSYHRFFTTLLIKGDITSTLQAKFREVLKRTDSSARMSNNAEAMEKYLLNKTDLATYVQYVSNAFDSGYLDNNHSQFIQLSSIIPENKKDPNLTLLASYQLLSSYNTENKNQPISEIDNRLLCASYQVTAALDWKFAVDTSLLWNLVEFTGENGMTTQHTETILLIYHQLVEKLISLKMLPSAKKDLINECLIITSLLAKLPISYKAFANTKYLDALLIYSTPEVQETADDTDLDIQYERKQLLFNIILPLSKNNQCMGKIVQSRFVDVLLYYIAVPTGGDTRRSNMSSINSNGIHLIKWMPNQIFSLQMQIFSILFHIIPYCYNSFIKLQGLQTVMKWLSVDSFLATNKNNSNEIKQATLRFLISFFTAISKSEYAETPLPEESELLSILIKLIGQTWPEEVICDIISIVSLLLRIPAHKDIFFAEGAVALLPFLKLYETKYSKGKSELLIITVIDCLWNSISTPQNMNRLIQLEGVDLLLDIIEICPASIIKNQILSVLIHITSVFPEATAALLKWESDKSKIQIHKLLIELWAKEEARLGVLTDNGVLADPDRPLTKKDHSARPQKTSLSLNREAADMRGSLYLLFTHVGFKDDKLTALDKGKLKLIQHYYGFKVAEEWADVSNELSKENLVPIPQDRRRIQSIFNENHETASQVQQYQKQLIQEEFKRQLEEERKTYQILPKKV